MKQNFDGLTEAVTPKRLTKAIEIAVIYAAPSYQQIKLWLESDNFHQVIDEICELVESSVDEKTWKRLKI